MSTRHKILFIGQEVTVNFLPGDISASREMMKFNHKKAVINRVVQIADRKAPDRPQYYYYYELEGLKSHAGIPFGFTRDMLKVG